MIYKRFPPAWLVEVGGDVVRVVETEEEADALVEEISPIFQDYGQRTRKFYKDEPWGMFVQDADDFPGWTRWGYSRELHDMILKARKTNAT